MDWNPTESYLDFAIMSGKERKRYYKLVTATDGIQYIQEISLLYRSCKEHCLNTYQVVSCFEYEGRDYLFMDNLDRPEPLYLQEYACYGGNKIELFGVEEPLKSYLAEKYWPEKLL